MSGDLQAVWLTALLADTTTLLLVPLALAPAALALVCTARHHGNSRACNAWRSLSGPPASVSSIDGGAALMTAPAPLPESACVP